VEQDSSFHRREFLAKVSATSAVAVTGLALTSWNDQPLLAGIVDPSAKEYEAFQGLEGDRFRAIDRQTDQSAILELCEVNVYRRSPEDKRPRHVRQHPFSLLFAAPQGESLDNAVFQLVHPTLGSVELFLHRTRCDNRPHHVFYEAVVG
jgi:hypothetical protein